MLKKIVKIISRLGTFLTLANLVTSRVFHLFHSSSRQQIEILFNSEVFSGSKVVSFMDTKFRERWTNATWLAKAGRYHEAIAVRKKVILDSRAYLGVEENFVPLILESGFISYFGHLALLSYIKSGMALEILPKRELMLVASSRKLNDRPFLRMSLQGLQFADPLATESIFNLDRLFAMSEKTVMVSSKDGLLDIQELVNGVEELGGSNINQTLSSLVLESEETIFQQKLNPYYKLGYSWFATIHIRQSSGKDSSRNNSIVSLMEIVAYLNSSGGFAILIGEDSKNTLGKDGFDYLDLRAVSKEQPFLVDLAIMKSRYFIGPDSGPGAIAVLLGIPSLRLDGVAFLKNTYSTHGPSVSLPKFWVDTQNQKVPLNKVLDSNLGFCEDDKLISSYKMVNNSAQDALAGFKLLETISKSSNRAEAHMDEFSRQKIAAGGIGSGLISPDFYNK